MARRFEHPHIIEMIQQMIIPRPKGVEGANFIWDNINLMTSPKTTLIQAFGQHIEAYFRPYDPPHNGCSTVYLWLPTQRVICHELCHRITWEDFWVLKKEMKKIGYNAVEIIPPKLKTEITKVPGLKNAVVSPRHPQIIQYSLS